MVGLDDVKGLFQPEWFCDSMIVMCQFTGVCDDRFKCRVFPTAVRFWWNRNTSIFLVSNLRLLAQNYGLRKNLSWVSHFYTMYHLVGCREFNSGKTFAWDSTLWITMSRSLTDYREYFYYGLSMPKCDHRTFLDSEKGCWLRKLLPDLCSMEKLAWGVENCPKFEKSWHRKILNWS